MDHRGDLLLNFILICAEGHLFDIISFRWTQIRTQNAKTLMPFLILLPLKSLQIQADWGGVVALSRR